MIQIFSNVNTKAAMSEQSVTVTLTYCGAAPIGEAKRCSRADRRRIEIPQPQVLIVYNMGVGGVDRLDQNLAAYMINHDNTITIA